MEIPWNCAACGHENMIDLQNLAEWPLDKLITAQGFTCENCGGKQVVSGTSISLREAEAKLSRYTPEHRQFRFLFAKLLRKASGMLKRLTQ